MAIKIKKYEGQIAWIELVTTRICNAPFCNPGPTLSNKPTSCFYCYQKSDQPRTTLEIKRAKMSQLTASQLKKLIREVETLGIRRFYFLGGEPLLRPDIGEILDYAAEHIDYTVISTNGTMVKENLKSLAKVSCVEVSLDSHIKEVAAKTRPLFLVEQAMAAIDLLVGRGIYTRVNAVLTPINAKTILAFLDYCFKKGVKAVNLYPIMGERHDNLTLTRKELFEISRKIMARYQTFLQTWCKIGRHLNVMADGKVTPCAAFIGENLVIGDIKRQSLRSILRSKILKDFQKYHFEARSNLEDYDPKKACPAVRLWKNNWQKPDFPIQEEMEEKFCLRCNRRQSEKEKQCLFCRFDKFSNEVIQPACHTFVIYPRH